MQEFREFTKEISRMTTSDEYHPEEGEEQRLDDTYMALDAIITKARRLLELSEKLLDNTESLAAELKGEQG